MSLYAALQGGGQGAPPGGGYTPGPSNRGPAAKAPAATSGLAQLLAGLRQFQQRTGTTKDPLIEQGGTYGANTMGASAPVLGSVPGLQRNTGTGQRAGQLMQVVDHGGATYHIYYGPQGQRQVFRVSGSPQQAQSNYLNI